MYFIVLHPRFKLAYFRHEKWPVEWIQTAEQLLHNWWTEHYKPSSMVNAQHSLGMVCIIYFNLRIVY